MPIAAGNVCAQAKVYHTAGAHPCFRSMKPTRSIATPPGWDASPSQVMPQNFVTGTHLYSWVERGTVKARLHMRFLM